MFNFKCDPATCSGPIDGRVVEYLSKRYSLDQDYLDCVKTCHGGEPTVGTVSIESRKYRLAKFLTLVDLKSDLPSPFKPHFDISTEDERAIDSIVYLMDYEHNTSRCLFTNIVPFATTRTGECFDRAYVDMFCFDYRDRRIKPPVVLWDACKAMDVYFYWNDLSIENKYDNDDNFINIDWDSFLVPVANSFAEFLDLLSENALPHP